MSARPLSAPAAHALLHLTVFVWGFTAILGRLISLGAVSLVFYRIGLVVLVMGGLILARRLRFDVPAPTVRRLMVAGVFVALHWMLFYGCIKYAGVAVAVLCLSSGTFFTACFEPLVFRRRPNLGELVLGVAVVGGVSLLVRVETQATALGLAMGLGSALFSAAFGTMNGQVARGVRSEFITLVELSTGWVVTGLFFFVAGADFVPPSAIGWRDLGLLLVLAVGCTVLPWQWSLRVLKTLSPYTVALAVALEPVYSMALAYVMFPDAEQLTWRFYAGAAVLLALVGLNGWLKRPAKAS